MFIFHQKSSRDILKDLFPEGLSPEKEEEILDKMTDLLQKRLLLRVADNLAGVQKEELDTLLKNNDPNEIGAFMEKNVENLEQILNEEIKKLRKEIAEFVKAE